MKEITEIKTYLTEEDRVILKKYQQMTDEQLLDLIRRKAEELGHLPVKADLELAWYFKSRFGPWPRMLEQAGLKPVSERHLQRQEKTRKRYAEMRRRTTEKRKQRREEKEAGGAELEQRNKTAAGDGSGTPADYSCGSSQRA